MNRLPHISPHKSASQYAHLDLDFHRDLSKMKKKSVKANHLESYLNKKKEVQRDTDKLLSNENKSLNCQVRKKKQMCAQAYLEMQKIVETRLRSIQGGRGQKDRIGDKSYSLE